jgi:hypothetical protein
MTSRIITSFPKGETPPSIWDEYDWFIKNREMLLEQYGSCIAVVYGQTVLGTGATFEEALENAENNLPPELKTVNAIADYIRPAYRLRRAAPSPIREQV